MREDVILHRIVTGDEKWVYYENVYLVGSRRYVRYKQQLMKRNQELKKKRLEYAKRYDNLLLLHDKTRPHVAESLKTYIHDINWEILPHPPHSLDIAPSDYHLF